MQSNIEFCRFSLSSGLPRIQGFRLFPLLFGISLLLGLYPPSGAGAQSASQALPLSLSDWSVAYSGQDASLASVTYGGQSALEWQVDAALGHSDWVTYYLPLQTDERYTFTVELAGSGTAALNIWNGEANVSTQPIQLSSKFQTLTETVSILSSNPQFQILDPDGTSSAVHVYFANPTVSAAGPASGLPIWQTAYGGQDSTLTSSEFAGSPALEWQVSAALGHSDWIYTYPPFTGGKTYQVSAQVAGSGTVAINVYDGNENVSGPPVTLTPNFQTITENVLALAPNSVVVAPGTAQLQLVDADTNGSSALTLYYKNVTWKQVVPPPMPPTGVSARLLQGDRNVDAAEVGTEDREGPAEYPHDESVRVTWNAPSECSGDGLPGITGYEIFVTAEPLAENGSSPNATVSGCGSGATGVTVKLPEGKADRARVFYANVVATSAAGNSAPSPRVSTERLGGAAGDAQTAVEELQTYYDAATGLFNTTGWWNSANALDAMVGYMKRTGSREYVGDLSNTFTKALNEAPPPTPGNFIDTAYDETQWWALTWLDAYELTFNPAYLQMAERLQLYVTGAWTPSQCGGGLVWQSTNTYQNAVTNELFLELSARLYLVTHQASYLHWAEKELTWFNASGLINSSHLVNDGLTTTCQNNGQTTWTYNQGIILGGLTAMYKATGEQTYLSEAKQIADAATSTLVSTTGVLTDPCTGICQSQNPDQSQFKGIFLRNLATLYEVTQDPGYERFIERNASSIWQNDRNVYDQIGYDWSGPISAADQSFNASTLGSGLDGLNAAVPVAEHQDGRQAVR